MYFVKSRIRILRTKEKFDKNGISLFGNVRDAQVVFDQNIDQLNAYGASKFVEQFEKDIRALGVL